MTHFSGVRRTEMRVRVNANVTNKGQPHAANSMTFENCLVDATGTKNSNLHTHCPGALQLSSRESFFYRNLLLLTRLAR